MPRDAAFEQAPRNNAYGVGRHAPVRSGADGREQPERLCPTGRSVAAPEAPSRGTGALRQAAGAKLSLRDAGQ